MEVWGWMGEKNEVPGAAKGRAQADGEVAKLPRMWSAVWGVLPNA
jgi:hypothetical protein